MQTLIVQIKPRSDYTACHHAILLHGCITRKGRANRLPRNHSPLDNVLVMYLHYVHMWLDLIRINYKLIITFDCIWTFYLNISSLDLTYLQ